MLSRLIRKKQGLILALLLFLSSCAKRNLEDVYSVFVEDSSYAVVVPIIELSKADIPSMPVEIEGRSLELDLDLGFRGDVSLSSCVIDDLQSKSLTKERTMYGVRGFEYTHKQYFVPEISIGAMTFRKLIFQEGSEQFLQDGTFLKEGEKASEDRVGALGWELFGNANLLIDIPGLRAGFADSFETLQKQSVVEGEFVCGDLLTERGLVECEAETSQGLLRCFLDTGSTKNIFNEDLRDGQSMDQAFWDEENQVEYPSFQIAGTEFGPMAFTKIPIHLPFHVDAVLGMEFFKEHVVFLDFKKEKIYISKGVAK